MSHTTLRPSTSESAAGRSRVSGSADVSDLPYCQLLEKNCPRYIQYSDEFRQEYEDSYCESSDDCVDDDDDDEDMDEDDLSEEDLDNGCPKYLIFSTGSKTYTPHQIGFKRVRSTNFPKKLEPGLSLKERIVAKERERRMQVGYYHLFCKNISNCRFFHSEERFITFCDPGTYLRLLTKKN